MSTSDLRAGGISAPTGFVHISGYGRPYQTGRCSSISGTPMSPPRESRARVRELANIDPKFTSQVSNSAIWRLAKKTMRYLIILINGQKMMYFVSKNATFTNQSQFHNLVTQ